MAGLQLGCGCGPRAGDALCSQSPPLLLDAAQPARVSAALGGGCGQPKEASDGALAARPARPLLTTAHPPPVPPPSAAFLSAQGGRRGPRGPHGPLLPPVPSHPPPPPPPHPTAPPHRVEGVDPEALMARSYRQFQCERALPGLEARVARLEVRTRKLRAGAGWGGGARAGAGGARGAPAGGMRGLLGATLRQPTLALPSPSLVPRSPATPPPAGGARRGGHRAGGQGEGVSGPQVRAACVPRVGRGALAAPPAVPPPGHHPRPRNRRPAPAPRASRTLPRAASSWTSCGRRLGASCPGPSTACPSSTPAASCACCPPSTRPAARPRRRRRRRRRARAGRRRACWEW